MSFVDKTPPLFDCIAVNYISDVYTYFSLQEAMFDRDEIKDFNDYCNYYLVDYNLKYLEEKVLSFKKDKNVNFVQYLLNSKFLFPIELTDNVKNDIIIYDVSSFIGGDEPLDYEITEKDYEKFADFFTICSQKFPLYLTLFNKIYDDVIFNSSIDLISEYIAKSEKSPKINYNTLLVLELEEYLHHQIPLIATDLKQNPSSDFSVDSFRILLFQVMSNLSSLVLNETETRSYLEQVKSNYIKNEVDFLLLSVWLRKLTTYKSPLFNYAYNWLVQDTNQRTPLLPISLADNSSHTIEEAYFDVVNRAKELSRGNIASVQKVAIQSIQPSKSNYIPLHSFTYPHYNTNKVAINDLLKHFIKCNYIAQDTDMVDFRKVFNNTPIEKKIIWTGNISELSYFIKQLHNIKKKVEDLKQKQWEATINCFVLSDGLPLDRNKLRSQKAPASTKDIETAVELL
jgi:hypothetical protein